MFLLFIFFAVLFLAYANGANDNFKGVATLFGSKTANFKTSLSWATLMTFFGSIVSIFLAQTLIKVFTGKGLVPDAIVSSHHFILSVGFGAALTVMIASVVGIPISTTHSLTGALFGAGFIASGHNINYSVLSQKFFLPLILSPLLAMLLTMILYPFFRFVRTKLGITREMCVCVGNEIVECVPVGNSKAAYTTLTARLGTNEDCFLRYQGSVLGFNCERLLNGLHFLSAGLVSFSRGLNDTPKIVALLIAAKILNIHIGLFAVGIAIAIGGVLSAKKVAHTMSHKITTMNHGQGFTANLITALLVTFASKIGVPVSTTHVSCGSLFGIGMTNGTAQVKTILGILLAWITTLPLAAVLSMSIYLLVT